MYVVQALSSIVQNNYGNEVDEEVEVNLIQPEVVHKIAMAAIVRTAAAYQSGSTKQASNMLLSLQNTLSKELEYIFHLHAEFVQLTEQIMASDLPEDSEKGGARLPGDPRVLRARAQGEHEGPSSSSASTSSRTPTEESLNAWATDANDCVFENNELFLGRAVVMPPIWETIQQAAKTHAWQDEDMALASLMGSRHQRVRFEAMNSISLMPKQCAPKLQKCHKLLVPALCTAMSEPVAKVQVQVTTAMTSLLPQWTTKWSTTA